MLMGTGLGLGAKLKPGDGASLTRAVGPKAAKSHEFTAQKQDRFLGGEGGRPPPAPPAEFRNTLVGVLSCLRLYASRYVKL